MRDVKKLTIEYMGYEIPDTDDEVILEILGLELAVKTAELRIALLKQGVKVSQMAAKHVMKKKVQVGRGIICAKYLAEITHNFKKLASVI